MWYLPYYLYKISISNGGYGVDIKNLDTETLKQMATELESSISSLNNRQMALKILANA